MENGHYTFLTPIVNHKTLEEAYQFAQRELTEHNLHRLFFEENEGRQIQVSVQKIASENGNKVGYSLSMEDITVEED